MRYLYSLILMLLLPFLFLRLWWRSKYDVGYQKRWSERLGAFPQRVPPGGIWLHAVSLGESIAATPLIKILIQQYPSVPIIVTSTTPTGSAYIRQQFQEQVAHSYLPFDLSFFIKRFLKNVKPKICIIMETELWPNLLHICRVQNIPLVLANARLSPRSTRGYRRVKFWMNKMLNSFTKVLAQSELDGQRFLSLGLKPEKLIVSGNIKFDLQLPPDLEKRTSALQTQLGDRLIWVAASTHEDEEEIILQAFALLRKKHSNLLLLLVPRHANRFDKVAALCKLKGFTLVRRSLKELPKADTDIYLGDSFGEMMLFYAVSDYAFVGGSLVAVGGHNLIEPASLALPILSGPELHNFKQVSELLLSEQALRLVHDATEMAEMLDQLICAPSQAKLMGRRALAVATANRGAVEKHQLVIEDVLKNTAR